jgi:hypothetical protein
MSVIFPDLANLWTSLSHAYLSWRPCRTLVGTLLQRAREKGELFMLSSDLHFDDHVPLVDACINRLQERLPQDDRGFLTGVHVDDDEIHQNS